MDSLFCLNTGFTSNDRNNVKKTFILNAHTLYFYLHKGKTCNGPSVVIDGAVTDIAVIDSPGINTFKFIKFIVSKYLPLKPLPFKKGSAISTQASRPSRYYLPLPFW